MAGKNYRLGPTKLYLKKERERVKFYSGLLAEVEAVQAELLDQIQPDPARSSTEDMYQKCDQLRAINNQGRLLNVMIGNRINKVLDVLMAGQSKGK